MLRAAPLSTSIQVEKFPGVLDPDGDLAVLYPAYLGGRTLQMVGDLLKGQMRRSPAACAVRRPTADAASTGLLPPAAMTPFQFPVMPSDPSPASFMIIARCLAFCKLQ